MAEGAAQIGTRSVLFTDLVGSTELRIRVGEEAADAQRRQHDALLADLVRQHGGVVVKGLGDGIMATFASAADAVATGVAIQQGLHDQLLEVRVGISIGDVSAEDGDVFGVPVVEASRLCAAAAAGEILTADLVRALARGRGGFAFEPIGELELRGLPEPMPACRVPWQPIAPVVSSIPITRAFVGPRMGNRYVGRKDLRQQLAAHWEQAREGVPRTVLLAGEPGVGKTRTAAHFATRAHREGTIVLYGRCDEDLFIPYQPFVEAVDHYVRHATPPVLGRLPGELARLLPDLPSRVAGIPGSLVSDPASEEHRLFEATSSWLIEAARDNERGLVLVLDDIQWATKPTLQLLQHVVRSAADEGAPLLVLATYRDTDIDRAHPLAAVVGDLRRLPGVDRITVDNLTRDEVVDFITAAAGHELDDVTSRLAVSLHDETEGNPFFVTEVVRHLVETGAVRREDDRWTVADPDHVTVPEGVRDVVGRRLNRLSATANEALSVASVIGRDFDVASLVSVVEANEDAAIAGLDEAVRARLVEETGVDCYRFSHALVRTTLYEEISATRRRRLHRKVADAVEKFRPDDVVALAHHCIEGGPVGGDVDRAVRYAILAAEQALAARAFAEAEVRFRSALELLEDGEMADPPERVVALCGLGEAQRDQGQPGFRETLLEASARAIELDNVDLLVRAVLANSRGLSSVISAIDAERVALIEAALDRVGPDPTAARARLLALLAAELTFSGQHDRRATLAAEAETMARALGDDALLARVLVVTGYAASDGRQWRRLIGRQDEAMQLADLTGDPALRILARVFASAALLTAGQLAESANVTLEMLAIADSERSPTLRWLAGANALRLPILAGRFDEAESRNNEAFELSNESEQPDGQQFWMAGTTSLAWIRGNGAAFADATGGVADEYPLSTIWRAAHIWLLAEGGREDEAREVLRRADLDPVRELAAPWPFMVPGMLGVAAWYLRDQDLAERVLAALTPYRECWAHYFLAVMGPVASVLGVASATLGHYDEAVALLEESQAALIRKNCVGAVPVDRIRLAQVLRARGAQGDAARAQDLLSVARAEAEALGAGGSVDRIDALLAG